MHAGARVRENVCVRKRLDEICNRAVFPHTHVRANVARSHGEAQLTVPVDWKLVHNIRIIHVRVVRARLPES